MIQNRTVLVPYSSAPILDGSAGNAFELTLSGDASVILRNFVPGQLYTVDVTQDGTGGHALAWPGNIVNAAPASTAANARTTQTFTQRPDGKAYAIRTAGITQG